MWVEHLNVLINPFATMITNSAFDPTHDDDDDDDDFDDDLGGAEFDDVGSGATSGYGDEDLADLEDDEFADEDLSEELDDDDIDDDLDDDSME